MSVPARRHSSDSRTWPTSPVGSATSEPGEGRLALDVPHVRRRHHPVPRKTIGYGKRKRLRPRVPLPTASAPMRDRTLRRTPHLVGEPPPLLKGEPQHRARPGVLGVADKHAATVASDLDTVALGRVAGLDPPVL